MATLKISDLSVGDWVQDMGGNYTKVVGIWQGSNFSYQVDCLRDDKADTITPCNLHPIPITAEILEKNGIHRTYEDDNHAIFWGDGLWAIKYSDGDWELSAPPVCCVDIKYVHQLQHALRLVGADKEINL